MPELASRLQKYSQINVVAKKGGIVFFGSNYFSELPISEILQDFNISTPIHNRSISHITIDETEKTIDTCITSLNPRKVFVNIGDEDIKKADFNCDEFISKYEWFLYSIHKKCKAEIYIISIIAETPIANKVNKCLEKLALDTGCQYIDAVKSLQYEKPELKIVDIVKQYVRSYPIDFADAMSMIAYKQ